MSLVIYTRSFHMPKNNNILLLGDFNMHIGDIGNADNIIFNDTMESPNPIKHVKSPTHRQGNILDLIFSEANGQLQMSNCQVNNYISDHAIITIDTIISKKEPPLTTNPIRDNSKITKENIQTNYKEPTIEEDLGLGHAYEQLTKELQDMLDRTAPLKEIKTREKPHKPYYNKYIRNHRKTVKTRQRTWLKYRPQHQWHAYKIEKISTTDHLNITKKQCITCQVHKNNKKPPKASSNL